MHAHTWTELSNGQQSAQPIHREPAAGWSQVMVTWDASLAQLEVVWKVEKQRDLSTQKSMFDQILTSLALELQILLVKTKVLQMSRKIS